MAGNADYTELIATTLKRYVRRLEEQVFTSKPFLWILKNSNSIQNEPGGTNLTVPLLYAESKNVGSYADSDAFSTDTEDQITAAEYPWRQFYGLVKFTGIELAKNSGPEAVLNLMRSRLDAVEMTMSERMEKMLLGDGTGNANKDFHGLEAIVDTSNPSFGNLGGIDRSGAGNSFWQAGHENNVGGALTLAVMRTAYNTVSEGNDHPTNIITDQDEFEAYEGLLQSNVRHEDVEMGDEGFQNLMYKGAPMVFSGYATAGVMYFVNMKYISLKKLANVWFKPSDMLQPTNQDAFFKHLLCYGNLVSSNNQRQGKLTGLTD